MKSQWLITHLSSLARHHRAATILVTRGPGSFTALRASIAAAHGLALAWQSSLYAMTSLEALALVSMQQHPHRKKHAMTQHIAGSSYVFSQNFERLTQEPFIKPTSDIESSSDIKSSPPHHHDAIAIIMAQWLASLHDIPTSLAYDKEVTPLYLKEHYAHASQK